MIQGIVVQCVYICVYIYICALIEGHWGLWVEAGLEAGLEPRSRRSSYWASSCLRLVCFP